MTVVSWHKLTLIGCPGMECQIDVDENGRATDDDGEPLPVSDRPNKCGAEGRWVLGTVFLCHDHAAEVAEMMGDDIVAIETAWKALL
jgi:hypothetical protein